MKTYTLTEEQIKAIWIHGDSGISLAEWLSEYGISPSTPLKELLDEEIENLAKEEYPFNGTFAVSSPDRSHIEYTQAKKSRSAFVKGFNKCLSLSQSDKINPIELLEWVGKQKVLMNEKGEWWEDYDAYGINVLTTSQLIETFKNRNLQK